MPNATLSPPEWFCIRSKMGSDESRFDIRLSARGEVARQRPQITIFEEPQRRAGGESNRRPHFQPRRFAILKWYDNICMYVCVCVCV